MRVNEHGNRPYCGLIEVNEFLQWDAQDGTGVYISIKSVHFKVCFTKDSNERRGNSFIFVKLFAEATNDKLKYSSNKKQQNHERRLLSVFKG